jgi:competence protein ComEC
MRSVLLFVAVWGSAAIAATAPAADLPVKNRLTLTFFEMQDVGGGCGLAIAIQTPGGRTWLYDTGLSGSKGKPFDAGRDAIAPFLRQHRIQRIDGILISHPHSDHYGGLPWLLEHFTVGRLIDTGYPSELVYENIHQQFAADGGDLTGEVRAYENIRKRFVAGGGKYQAVLAGDRLDLDTELQVDVLAPPKGFFGETHPENRPKRDPPWHYLPNKNSMILRIRHGKITILIPGDIEEQHQREFLQGYFKPGDLKAAILLAPGHGIHSIPEFAQAVQPEVVVASCLRRYGGGQKAKSVYGKLRAKVYSTDSHGQIQIVSDGQRYTVTTQRSGN